MHASRMHDVEIDRYPTISTSACVRSGPRRAARDRPSPRLRMPSRRERRRSGAAPTATRPMPSGTVLSYGPRPEMVPMGDIEVGIGSHSLAAARPRAQKVDFRPREAPSAAAAR
eukprot:1688809-Prymnesium_polylepis.1